MTHARLDPGRMFSLAGKSILVSGAGGVLGGATALALTQAGARLTLADAAGHNLDAVTEATRDLGAEVATCPRWPECEADADAIVAAAALAYGGIDGIVIANGANSVADIVAMQPEDWRAVMDANVHGPWLLCRAAGRQMIAQRRGGKVVILSSTRGKLGHAGGYSAYSTSKAAVDGLVRTLACEWGKHGITVNAVAPTVVRSGISAWLFADDEAGKAARAGVLARIPLGRLAEPDDIVGGIYFLLSPGSDFCTGQVIYLDGGFTAG